MEMGLEHRRHRADASLMFFLYAITLQASLKLFCMLRRYAVGKSRIPFFMNFSLSTEQSINYFV